MAEFLTTRGTSSQIENIINNAKKRITLISPYVKIPDTLFQNLKVADRKEGMKITLVYGKDELKPDVENQLKQLNNLSLHFLKELHAKCFFNEECMVITSMNLYDFSEINNKEMVVLIRAKDKDDEKVYNEAVKEIEIIIKSAKPVKLRSSTIEKVERVGKGIMKVGKLVSDSLMDEESRTPSRTRTTSRTSKPGFCIRCGTPIPYNIDRPLCDEHFKVWAQYEDLDYPEKHCHTCGKSWSTTKARPQCNSCYKPRG